MAARVLLCVLVACALFFGCSDDKDKDPVIEESRYLPLNLVANVLANLVMAYEEKDHGEYANLLADDFIFEFDPNDVVGEDNVPESGVWGAADEKIAAEHMFTGQPNTDGYSVDAIQLSLNAGELVTSERNPAWKRVTLSQVNLSVQSVHPNKGTLTYLVQGDQAILHFVEVSANVWKIAYWEDKPISLAAPATETTSWGQIKANWR